MFGLFGYSYLLANKDKIKATALNGVKPLEEGGPWDVTGGIHFVKDNDV